MQCITYADVKEAAANEVGICPDSEEMRKLVNMASRWLWEDETYIMQQQLACYSVTGQCLVLDREHAAFADVMSFRGQECPESVRLDLKNRRWRSMERRSAMCCQELALMEIGTVVVHTQVPEGKWRLMAVSDRPEDEKAYIRVEGLDLDSRPIHYYEENGEEMALVGSDPNDPKPPVFSEWYFSRITSVYKSKTKGYVYLYAYDPVSTERILLARYHPLDTSPCFAAYTIEGMCCDPCNDKPLIIEGLATPAYREVLFDWDVMPVQSLHAILNRIRAEKLECLDSDANEYRANLENASILNNKARSRHDKRANKTQGPSTWNGMNFNRHVSTRKIRNIG